MEKIQMQIEGAKFKFESKMDIYNIMKYQSKIMIDILTLISLLDYIYKLVLITILLVGYFLPSYRRCPMLFLKDIMNGTKKVSDNWIY